MEEEGRGGGRGERGHEAYLKGDLGEKTTTEEKDEIEGLHRAGVGSPRKSGTLARRKRWIREEKQDEEACTNYLLSGTIPAKCSILKQC